jgi:hypothetical protein
MLFEVDWRCRTRTTYQEHFGSFWSEECEGVSELFSFLAKALASREGFKMSMIASYCAMGIIAAILSPFSFVRNCTDIFMVRLSQPPIQRDSCTTSANYVGTPYARASVAAADRRGRLLMI